MSKPELDTQAGALVARAKEIPAKLTPTLYVEACEAAKAVVAYRKSVQDVFAPLKAAAHEAHRTICAEEKRYLDVVAPVEATLRKTIATYDEEQETLRRQEEARLQELAREKAEREQLEAAYAAEAMGEPTLAEEIMDAPAEVRQVRLPDVTPRPVGVSSRETWTFEIVDEAAIPRQYMTPDSKAIGGVVKMLKGKTQIPGIRVYAEKGVAIRA